jgi:hypothetical protein
MEIAKLAVAVLAGAVGGFAAAKLFGGKKDVQDEHVVLKVWGAEESRKPLFEVPMRAVKEGWLGGTPCAVDAFTVSRIDKRQYESLVERLKKAYDEEQLVVAEETDPAEEAEELEVAEA